MGSPLPRPPRRWRIEGRNLRWPQRHKMAALVWIASNLRAVLTPHVTFQFVDGCGFRPADDIQRHRLMRIAAKAVDLKIEISGVQASPSDGDGWAGPLKPSVRWFQASRRAGPLPCALPRRARRMRGQICRRWSGEIRCPSGDNALTPLRSASRNRLGPEGIKPLLIVMSVEARQAPVRLNCLETMESRDQSR
jgi:hypothetical protein